MHEAILLPGSILPKDLAYGALIAALGADAHAVAKDLEVYATASDAPPAGYGLELDLDAPRAFERPVYYALGELSNQRWYGRMAERARDVFDDFTPDVFGGRHHLDPPHRAEPKVLSSRLSDVWQRAEAAVRA